MLALHLAVLTPSAAEQGLLPHLSPLLYCFYLEGAPLCKMNLEEQDKMPCLINHLWAISSDWVPISIFTNGDSNNTSFRRLQEDPKNFV